MKQEELLLFNELIKETVRATVKEIIKEELSDNLRKDIRDVKLLLAKSIKESVALRESGGNNYQPIDRSELKNKIREAVAGDEFRDLMTTKKRSPIPMMSQETAVNVSLNGTLPDFDAPIPFIKKDSIAWKEMQEKLM
jgi:hypothetical protein